MKKTRYLMRNLGRTAFTGRAQVVFPDADERRITHETDAPRLWSELLQKLSRPQQQRALTAPGTAPADLDDAFLDRLVAAGHLLADDDPAPLLARRNEQMSSSPGFHFAPEPAACKHLVLGCAGSVVAGLMAQTLLSFSYSGFQEQLDVILTETAMRFLARDLLEAYGVRCWSDGFERQDGVRVPHVALARSAEIICVLPATANALDRIARSACSDLLSLCITASAAPVLLCPAMSGAMWNNPGVQRNLDTLRQDGRFILEPTIIFGAADFSVDAEPMYGGHGTLWGGPLALMQALTAVLSAATSSASPVRPM